MGTTMMMIMMNTRILRGLWPIVTRSCKAHRKLLFPHRAWGLPRGRKTETMRVAKRRCHLVVGAPTHLLSWLGVRPSCRCDLPKRLS